MSAYLVLVAVVLSVAVLAAGVHLVGALRGRRAQDEEDGGPDRPLPTRDVSRAWEPPLVARHLPALLTLGLGAPVLPLLLWGAVLRDREVGVGVFWVGVSVIAVLGVAGLHAWRRGEALS